MKLSQLIANLQDMQTLHGDCKVSTNDLDQQPVVRFNQADADFAEWVDIR